MLQKTVFSTLLLIALAACNPVVAAPGNGSSSGPTTDPQVLIGQAVSQTSDAQTQIAGAVQQTVAAMVTDTPEKPSETPLPTFTFTPEIPRVSVSVETNCRSGPGTAYEVLGFLPVGQTAEVVGRSASSDNWIIKLPSNPAITCWLWGNYASVTGNTEALPVIIPPPLPTPAYNFNMQFVGLDRCSEMRYVRISLTNTGNVAWESFQIYIIDQTTSDISSTLSLDIFPDAFTCGETTILLDLTPGESGIIYSFGFNHDLPGHQIHASVTLCT